MFLRCLSDSARPETPIFTAPPPCAASATGFQGGGPFPQGNCLGVALPTRVGSGIARRANIDCAALAEGVLTQDVAYSIYVVSAGWDERLEELAALLGARFRLPTSAVMNGLQTGEVTVAEANDLQTASSMVEALAELSIVAMVRPSKAYVRPPEQTVHLGWGRSDEAVYAPANGSTVQGVPSQIVDSSALDGLADAATLVTPGPGVNLASSMPDPWASALAPPLSPPAGLPRSSLARDRAALLRGEVVAGNTARPVAASAGVPHESPAITRIPSVGEEVAQTIILADVSAQAVASLQDAGSAAQKGMEPLHAGPWGAVLGKAVEAPLVAASSTAFTELTTARTPQGLSDEGSPLFALGELTDSGEAPNAADRKAFVRLRSPDEGRPALSDATVAVAPSTVNRTLAAALFSVLAPGAGQAYNNQQARAVTFALAGVLIVPWLLSIRDAWLEAAAGINRKSAGTPNVRAAVSVALTFWLLVGLFGTFIWSIDRATTDVTSSEAPTATAVQTPVPSVPLREEQRETEEEIAREASADSAAARADLRERVAGLVARAQIACNTGEYVDCRQLAEQALALDETDPGAHRVHVVAVEGISGFQERSDAAVVEGSGTGSAPRPRPAIHPRGDMPERTDSTTASSPTPARLTTP
jgi:hypothetical protein